MNRWYYHKKHGYMLRRFSFKEDGTGYDMVVTALVADSASVQRDAASWGAHKSRLLVNAGCGVCSVDVLAQHDHNPDFRRLSGPPPDFILNDFVAASQDAS